MELKQIREWMATYGTQRLSSAELLTVIGGHRSDGQKAKAFLEHHTLVSLRGMELAELEQWFGPISAARLQAAFALTWQMAEIPTRITCPLDAATFILPRFMGLHQEELWVILLDTKNKVRWSGMIYRGNVNSSIVRVAEMFRPAIRLNCHGMIIAHNHPSGETEPSPEDIQLTRVFIEAGTLMGIEIEDHLIISSIDGTYCSMKERGLVFNKF